MERFSQRESVLLGYSPQSSLMNASSPRSADRNSDIDFKDVFGGPPRRSSVHEIRYSYSEGTDNPIFREHDEASGPLNSWNGLSEKPVFGEEGLTLRRYPSENFFDDIFRGNEPSSSSPRKRDWDPYSSSPGSRVLSPARPLPPKGEPFGSSVPAQFSLPAKLTKLMELPTFGPAQRSTFKSKDCASNGTNFYSSPLSRSSSLKQGHEDKDDAPSYRQSLLSRELSLSSKESSNLTKYDETDQGGDSKKDTNTSEVPEDFSQFHFSIYKWASKGLPLAMPLRGENVSRLKENIDSDRCSGPAGRTSGESTARELPTETLHDAEISSNDRISANSKLHDKQNNGSPPVTSTQDGVEPCQRAFADDTISQKTREETKSQSKSEIGLSNKLENKISVIAETDKTEWKALRSLLSNDDYEQSEEKTKKACGKESTVKSTKKSSIVFDFSKNMKKQDGKRTSSDNAEVGKASLQSSTMNSGDPGKSRVKGKVKEFVKIFNQEPLSKTKTTVESQSQSSKRKEISTSKAEKEVNISRVRTDETIYIPKGHERKSMPNASSMVDDFQHSQKQPSSMKNTNRVSNGTSKQNDSSGAASMPNGSKVVGDQDDSFRKSFQVKELTQDENKLPQGGNDPEDSKAIDAKIRQWSNGKEGNIRSMLSTLQFVLWPESGWKPIPLVDIIEGNAVKRSYQKALLCLHPDKLQQKGAASHQKYIAEKVFDILQDAWTHFNSLGSL